jgi:hypothetical protein
MDDRLTSEPTQQPACRQRRAGHANPNPGRVHCMLQESRSGNTVPKVVDHCQASLEN